MRNGDSTVRDRIRIRITDSTIGAEDATSLVSSSDGALVIFLGVVRDSTESKTVNRLDYEAYSEMAEKEMERIAEEALSKWKVGSIAIVHRVGSLEVGECSVVVGVSAPHRGEAFDACEFCIDTLKQTVPIWKKEIFEDGSSSWVNHP